MNKQMISVGQGARHQLCDVGVDVPSGNIYMERLTHVSTTRFKEASDGPRICVLNCKKIRKETLCTYTCIDNTHIYDAHPPQTASGNGERLSTQLPSRGRTAGAGSQGGMETVYGEKANHLVARRD